MKSLPTQTVTTVLYEDDGETVNADTTAAAHCVFEHRVLWQGTDLLLERYALPLRLRAAGTAGVSHCAPHRERMSGQYRAPYSSIIVRFVNLPDGEYSVTAKGARCAARRGGRASGRAGALRCDHARACPPRRVEGISAEDLAVAAGSEFPAGTPAIPHPSCRLGVEAGASFTLRVTRK